MPYRQQFLVDRPPEAIGRRALGVTAYEWGSMRRFGSLWLYLADKGGFVRPWVAFTLASGGAAIRESNRRVSYKRPLGLAASFG